MDLETGAIVAAEIHPANEGDTSTMWGTLEKAAECLQAVRNDQQVVQTCQANGVADPSGLRVEEVVNDKGYHSAQTLVNLEELDIRGYIAEPQRGRQRWMVAGKKSLTDAKRAPEQEFKRMEQAAVRKLTGFGTPRGWADALRAFLRRQVEAVRRARTRIASWIHSGQHPTSTAPLALAA